MKMRAALVVLVLGLLPGLSACGRKSGLDTPYEAGIEARKQAEKDKKPLPPEPEKPVEDRPFILDSLI